MPDLQVGQLLRRQNLPGPELQYRVVQNGAVIVIAGDLTVPWRVTEHVLLDAVLNRQACTRRANGSSAIPRPPRSTARTSVSTGMPR